MKTAHSIDKFKRISKRDLMTFYEYLMNHFKSSMVHFDRMFIISAGYQKKKGDNKLSKTLNIRVQFVNSNTKEYYEFTIKRAKDWSYSNVTFTKLNNIEELGLLQVPKNSVKTYNGSLIVTIDQLKEKFDCWLTSKGKWAAPCDSNQALRLQRYLIKGGLKRDKIDKSMLKSKDISASYSLGKEMFVLHIN